MYILGSRQGVIRDTALPTEFAILEHLGAIKRAFPSVNEVPGSTTAGYHQYYFVKEQLLVLIRKFTLYGPEEWDEGDINEGCWDILNQSLPGTDQSRSWIKANEKER